MLKELDRSASYRMMQAKSDDAIIVKAQYVWCKKNGLSGYRRLLVKYYTCQSTMASEQPSPSHLTMPYQYAYAITIISLALWFIQSMCRDQNTTRNFGTTK